MQDQGVNIARADNWARQLLEWVRNWDGAESTARSSTLSAQTVMQMEVAAVDEEKLAPGVTWECDFCDRREWTTKPSVQDGMREIILGPPADSAPLHFAPSLPLQSGTYPGN
jgi:hypothetical protein